MARKFKIGVIGTGARGEGFTRELFAGTSRAELFGVCDIDQDRLGRFSDFCGLKDVPRFTDPHEFLRQPGLDAVMVTTPEFTHRQVAVEAMLNGKHVYCEKPIAHTIEDGREIMLAQRQTGMTAYVGFNLRASAPYMKLKEVVASGVLGQLVHISGMEQLSAAHGASFMRRFHRRSSQSGGLLNHKCSHDLDIMLWVVGHEHKVAKVSSFGGTSVLLPQRRPPGVTRCGQCPPEIHGPCAYKDKPGFVFPVNSAQINHRDASTYGGDLCVFNDEKDLVDNQTVIMEWDNGLRGNFNLQMFQKNGRRETRIWGEKGFAELGVSSVSGDPHGGFENTTVRVISSQTGDLTEYRFAPRTGGHGGGDPLMIDRFVDAFTSKQGSVDSGISQGLAATILAVKADQSRLSGQVVQIQPQEYA